MHRSALLAFATVLVAYGPAMAEPRAAVSPGGDPEASLTLERHHTTNVLDGTQALSDWYTLLRGSFGHALVGDGGRVGIAAEFEATRHDRYGIEDDIQGAVRVEAARTLGERVELRGAVEWRRGVDGDDLGLPDLVIGTRTATDVVGAVLTLGATLTPDTTLVLESENSLELPGETRFEDDLIPPLRLEPERRRHRLSAAVTRQRGKAAHGVRAYAGIVDAEPLGDPPAAISFYELGLRGEAKSQHHGMTFAMAAGAAALIGMDGMHRAVRPLLDLSLEIPVDGGAAVAFDFSAGFETADTDDPLGSWVRRGQVEVKVPLAPRLALGAGIFSEYVENLLLGYDERGHGVYGELTYAANRHFSAVLRADYEKRRFIGTDLWRDRLDTFLGVKAAL